MNSVKESQQTQVANKIRGLLTKYLSYILSAVALLIFFIYILRNVNRYRQLINLSYNSLLSLLALILVFNLVKGLINYYLYRSIKVPLMFSEGFGLAVVNTLANQLPFAGGLIAKGAYLRKRHRLAYTHFLSATLALYVTSVAMNGILGLVVLLYWKFVRNVSVPNTLLLGFSIMSASLLLFQVPLKIGFVPGRWGKRLSTMLNGWHILNRDWKLLCRLIVLQLAMTLLFAWRFRISFQALSQDATIAQCILFSAGNVLTTLVTITPGGLGVREGIVAGIASLLGFEAGVSAVAVGIDRLVATSVVIVLGTIYTYILSKKATGDPMEEDYP